LIAADHEDGPKQLCARLGFRPASTAMELLPLPRRRSGIRPAAAHER
jgi:hypothetical protein